MKNKIKNIGIEISRDELAALSGADFSFSDYYPIDIGNGWTLKYWNPGANNPDDSWGGGFSFNYNGTDGVDHTLYITPPVGWSDSNTSNGSNNTSGGSDFSNVLSL
jgi:hypothetical protein